jgi:hypothetical protein
LAVWTNCEVAHDEEFNVWYSSQHLAERFAVPGFLSARRYVSINARQRHLAFYETESAAVLSAAPYLERLHNPTDWSRRTMAWFRDTNRSVFHQVIDSGAGIGSIVQSYDLAPDAGAEIDYTDLLRPLARAVMQSPAMVRLRLWRGDTETSSLASVERSLRPAPDVSSAWTLLLEAESEGALDTAQRIVADRAIAGLAAPQRYRLLRALSR